MFKYYYKDEINLVVTYGSWIYVSISVYHNLSCDIVYRTYQGVLDTTICGKCVMH